MINEAQAFRQGELDNLCGLYAIVNGLLACDLGNKSDNKKKLGERIFATAVDAMIKSKSLRHQITLGACSTTMKRVIDECIKKHFKDTLVCDQPFSRKPGISNEAFWNRLSDEFALMGAIIAIQGIRKPLDHWIIFHLLADEQVTIVDSLPSAKRNYTLKARHGIYVGRKPDAGGVCKCVPRETFLIRVQSKTHDSRKSFSQRE